MTALVESWQYELYRLKQDVGTIAIEFAVLGSFHKNFAYISILLYGLLLFLILFDPVERIGELNK